MYMMSAKRAIVLIVFFGALLRCVGISFGLPFVYHQDEPMMVNHALAIGAGDWNTHYFVIPPFVNYFLFFIYAAFYVLAHLFGIFKSPTDFILYYLTDPTLFYLLGRFFIGALFGTLTILITAKIGYEFFSEKVAVLAAFFIAVCPIHVQYSHYIYADSPVTFAITLLAYYHLKILKEPSYKNYSFAGLVLGWGTAIKYTAAYFAPILFFVHLLCFGRTLFSKNACLRLILLSLCALLVFALIAPYTFIDWRGFYGTFLKQSQAQNPVGLGHYFYYSILNGTSLLFAFCAIVGAFFLIKDFKKQGLVLFAFCAWFYILNSFFGQHYSRYILPIIPILAIWAALSALKIQNFFKKTAGRVFMGCLFLSLLIPMLYMNFLFLTKDTRTECLEWLNKNIPQGSGVIVDNRFFAPHLPQTDDQLLAKSNSIPIDSLSNSKRKKLDLMRKANQNKKTYNVYTLSNIFTEDSEFQVLKPFVSANWSDFNKIGAQYLILNTTEKTPEAQFLRKSLFSHATKIAEFSPYFSSTRKEPIDAYASTAAPHALREIFARKRLGPYLEVYAIHAQ